jgi:hypothetical protein
VIKEIKADKNKKGWGRQKRSGELPFVGDMLGRLKVVRPIDFLMKKGIGNG